MAARSSRRCPSYSKADMLKVGVVPGVFHLRRPCCVAWLLAFASTRA